MDASASIAIIEKDLRRLIETIYREHLGNDWQEENLPEVLKGELRKRQVEEAKRRAPATVSSNLLDYCHLHQLIDLIEKKWELFAPALGEKKEFQVLMGKVEDFRNAPAHSRELLPFELTLLEGIAGQVRTKVTIFLSQTSQDSMHYPVIESLTDPFGNSHNSAEISTISVVQTKLRLQVGQVVEFSARAWDPQGREITWSAWTNEQEVESVVGTDVTLKWTIRDAEVGRARGLHVSISSTGPYHRYFGSDQEVTFFYTVDPPII